MIYLILLITALLGLVTSIVLHILTFFGIGDLWLSIGLFIGIVVLILPGLFFLPGLLPPYIRGDFRSNYNFWRPIPKYWRNLISVITIYTLISGFLTGIVYQQDNFLPLPYSTRVVTGVTILLFLVHTIIFWYHAPVQERKRWIELTHSKRKSNRHHSKIRSKSNGLER